MELKQKLIIKLEKQLYQEGEEEYDNNPIDSYFNGVRAGIIEYHNYLIQEGLP